MTNKTDFIEKQLYSINGILEIHGKIMGISKSLEQLYPIAVVEDNVFYVFDLDKSNEKYEYKMEYISKMDIPKGVLAAFPLGSYNNKISAVVSSIAFDNIEGYVFIFHEFVHCFQFNGPEMEIKRKLTVAKEAMEKNDYMWELNHPFPYENDIFIEKTKELDNIVD